MAVGALVGVCILLLVLSTAILLLVLAAALQYRYYILTFILLISALPGFIVGGAIAFALKPNPAMYIGTAIFFILLLLITKFVWRWVKRKIFGELPAVQPAAIPAVGPATTEETTRFGRR